MRKRMKMLWVASLALIVAFSFSGTNVFAAKNEEKVIFEEKEIVDPAVLYEKAKKEKDTKLKSNAYLKDEKGNKLKAKTFATTQVLKVVQKGNEIEKHYVTTTFAEPEFTENTDDSLVSIASSGSKNLNKYDGSYSVKATSTIYWNESTYNGSTMVDLDKVYVAWSKLDSTVTLSNRKFQYGQSGWAVGGAVTQVSPMIYLSGDSISYLTNSEHKPVSPDADSGVFQMGVNSYVDITRSSGTWQLVLQNHY